VWYPSDMDSMTGDQESQGSPPSMAGKVVLFNALRSRKDIYVLVGGKPRLLPRVSPPVLLSKEKTREEFHCLVYAGGSVEEVIADTEEFLETTLEIVGESSPSCVIGDLPKVDGVWYLVDPITQVQFPYRDDFVVPNAYSMYLREKVHVKSKKKRRKAIAKAIRTMDRGEMFPLVSVARGPVPIATEDTAILSRDD